MATEKLQTEIRQEQIAEAALSLVASHGIRALSMERIARRVGLVPSAIYRHFKGKDEILHAILNLIRTWLLGNVDAVCKETSDPLERLHVLLRRHIQMIRQNESIPRVVFSEEVYNDPGNRKDQMYRNIKEYIARLSEIIAQGQQDGRIRPELSPETISVMFLGLIHPATLIWHLSDGRFDVTGHIERSWEIFREAIEAK